MKPVTRWIREPFDDYVAAIDRLREDGLRGAPFAILAAAIAWFAYVPVHELLHAWGCMATGGTVTRLDISPEYGGRWLATIFPYVRSGSEYAGQLSGFDTGGSDLTYLATVLAPYLLTVLAGVPLLKIAGTSRGTGTPRGADVESAGTRRFAPSSRVRPWLLGIAVVLAYAPVVSLVGDYYEAGSIVVSRIGHAFDASIPVSRWRSDDLPKLAGSLQAAGATAVDWIGVTASFAAGTALALLTWRAGSLVHRAAVRG